MTKMDGSTGSGSVRVLTPGGLARGLAGLILGAWCAVALGADNVLIDRVPAGVDGARVLEAVRDALQYRKWTVVPADKAESVAAKIERATVQARIVIWQQGDKLLYEESAEDGRRTIDFRGVVLAPQKIPTPARWIANLRSDITERLQAQPAGAVAAPAPTHDARSAPSAPEHAAKPNAVQRMQELKDLLDKGLVSKEEYERKRAQILDDL